MVAPMTSGGDRAGRLSDVGWVLVFFLCSFWLTNSGFETSEAVYQYAVARNVVETGRLGFDHPMEGIFHTAPNGMTYGAHEIGNAVVLIPVATLGAVANRVLLRLGFKPELASRVPPFITSFQAGLQAALALALLYLILTREYGQSPRAAFAGSLAVGFGTYYWSYSRSLYDGMLCLLLLVAALVLLLRYRGGASVGAVVGAFTLLGFSIITRLTMVLPTAAAFLFILMSGRRPVWRPLMAGALALVPFGVWQLWYNSLRTGNPLVSPVQTAQYAANNALDGHLGTGLIGLTLSPGKSIFVYAPLLVLAIAAFPSFWRRDRASAMFVLVSGGLWLLLHAKLRSWYGAWGWGPRHLITLLPILALPALVALPGLWAKRWGRTMIVVATTMGVVLGAAAIVGNWHFRLELAVAEGREGDATFVWGRHSQAVDMLAGAGSNLLVVAGRRQPIALPTYSDLDNYASNRINVWWLTLARVGVPRMALGLACAVLLVGLVWAAARLAREPGR